MSGSWRTPRRPTTTYCLMSNYLLNVADVGGRVPSDREREVSIVSRFVGKKLWRFWRAVSSVFSTGSWYEIDVMWIVVHWIGLLNFCNYFLYFIIFNSSVLKFYLRNIRNTVIESIIKYFIYKNLILYMGMVFRILTQLYIELQSYINLII